MPQLPQVLFLCTGNSCRSQMAEGWTRALHNDRIEALSAGIETHGLNRNAVRVMSEAGVDISGQRSQLFSEFDPATIDLIVTVCGHADEHCPVIPAGVRKVHVPFDDPPRLAQDAATEADALDHYRRVRDEIRTFVADELPKYLERRGGKSS